MNKPEGITPPFNLPVKGGWNYLWNAYMISCSSDDEIAKMHSADFTNEECEEHLSYIVQACNEYPALKQRIAELEEGLRDMTLAAGALNVATDEMTELREQRQDVLVKMRKARAHGAFGGYFGLFGNHGHSSGVGHCAVFVPIRARRAAISLSVDLSSLERRFSA